MNLLARKLPVLFAIAIVYSFIYFLISFLSSQTSLPPEPKSRVPEPEIQGTNISPPEQTISKAIPSVANKGVSAIVIKVIDGDTVSVSIEGKKETIRIIGINTPETVDPRRPVECFGTMASVKAKELLTNQVVQLEIDPTQGTRDKYGRLLAYVWLDNGTKDYGAYMLGNGFAYEYTYDTSYKYQMEYKRLQKEAEVHKRGLWGDIACQLESDTQKEQSIPSQESSSTTGGDKDCRDFSTQTEAQAYFDGKGGSSVNNIDKLDGGDSDGKVCEILP